MSKEKIKKFIDKIINKINILPYLKTLNGISYKLLKDKFNTLTSFSNILKNKYLHINPSQNYKSYVKDVELLTKKIKDMENSFSMYNRMCFERMIEDKEVESLHPEAIWKIIETSRKAIFPPMELFGFEKLFSNVCFADRENVDKYKNADCMVFWGHHIDSIRVNMILYGQMYKIPILLMEDGFIRSVYPNAKKDVPWQFRTSVGYTADFKRCAFDGFGPSTLEELLNSDLELSEEQLNRSRDVINILLDNKISKYNHQPIVENFQIGRDGAYKILIIDQSVSDWSIRKGSEPENVFDTMLLTAIEEHPEADIIIKTHPDMLIKRKKTNSLGHYTHEQIADLSYLHNNIYIYEEEINPICLLNSVDEVYVYSSQMGFEALLCGKKVSIFGMPFYAGWGVGFQRSHNQYFSRRIKKRSIEEIFFIVYIIYSRYFHPIELRYIEIEEALEILIQQREMALLKRLPSSNCTSINDEKKVSIAFSFDAKYYRQATVAIATLLNSSNVDTRYDIYCLCSDDVDKKIQSEILSILSKQFLGFTIEFVPCSISDNAFEIRGISKVTYNRLLLPDLLPKVDKIIYSDVDVIFRADLLELYKTDIGGHFIGACIDISLNSKKRFMNFLKNAYMWKEEFMHRRGKYMHAGFLVMNLKELRKQNIQKEWKRHLGKRYYFQDMDIINITCKDKFYTLPSYYSHNPADISTGKHIEASSTHMIPVCDLDKYLHDPAVIHYAGVKPWNNKSLAKSDLWWKAMYQFTPYSDYFTSLGGVSENGK